MIVSTLSPARTVYPEPWRPRRRHAKCPRALAGYVRANYPLPVTRPVPALSGYVKASYPLPVSHYRVPRRLSGLGYQPGVGPGNAFASNIDWSSLPGFGGPAAPAAFGASGGGGASPASSSGNGFVNFAKSFQQTLQQAAQAVQPSAAQIAATPAPAYVLGPGGAPLPSAPGAQAGGGLSAWWREPSTISASISNGDLVVFGAGGLLILLVGLKQMKRK